MMTLARGARWMLGPLLAGFLVAPLPSAWAQELEEEFRIGTGDVLRIDVWKDDDLSSTVRVRPDGVIAMPVVGEFKVAGRTTADVQVQLKAALSEFLTAPSVTVIVEEINSRKVYVTGYVASPGAYDLLGPTRLMQAIALAGGTTEFAKEDRIVVLREPGGERFQASVKAITSGQQPDDNILLRPGDTVIVP
jgi:polysaccharide biosynthesis/export protein